MNWAEIDYNYLNADSVDITVEKNGNIIRFNGSNYTNSLHIFEINGLRVRYKYKYGYLHYNSHDFQDYLDSLLCSYIQKFIYVNSIVFALGFLIKYFQK